MTHHSSFASKDNNGNNRPFLWQNILNAKNLEPTIVLIIQIPQLQLLFLFKNVMSFASLRSPIKAGRLVILVITILL